MTRVSVIRGHAESEGVVKHLPFSLTLSNQKPWEASPEARALPQAFRTYGILVFAATSFNYNRFFGLASDGFGVYDTGASGTSLPNYYSIARDYKTPTFLGLGAGGGFSANLRAGVNLNVQGGLGSAALNLSDSVEYNWSRMAIT